MHACFNDLDIHGLKADFGKQSGMNRGLSVKCPDPSDGNYFSVVSGRVKIVAKK